MIKWSSGVKHTEEFITKISCMKEGFEHQQQLINMIDLG